MPTDAPLSDLVARFAMSTTGLRRITSLIEAGGACAEALRETLENNHGNVRDALRLWDAAERGANEGEKK